VITAAAPALTQAPYWYLTRSTGIVSFVLLTIALVFGVAATQRALASPAWPRFATQTLHRNVSLLAGAFLLVHIVTTIVDGYAPVGWWAAVLPGASAYRTLWVALGTVSFDLLLLVIVTSLLRRYLRVGTWRWIHYSVYALWPLTLLHFLKTGTDAAHNRFGIWIALAGTAVVLVAIAVRLVTRADVPQPVRSIR
jgi:sulfoxide reductase heme-binding subunit YedZ